jgi:hypothetical protein
MVCMLWVCFACRIARWRAAWDADLQLPCCCAVDLLGRGLAAAQKLAAYDLLVLFVGVVE